MWKKNSDLISQGKNARSILGSLITHRRSKGVAGHNCVDCFRSEARKGLSWDDHWFLLNADFPFSVA